MPRVNTGGGGGSSGSSVAQAAVWVAVRAAVAQQALVREAVEAVTR